jgi:hypothetical protein
VALDGGVVHAGKLTRRSGDIATIATVLGIVVSAVLFPWKLIKRRLIATFAVALFWHVEFLMFVVFDAGAVLIAPTLPFSINATRFHGHTELTHTRF